MIKHRLLSVLLTVVVSVTAWGQVCPSLIKSAEKDSINCHKWVEEQLQKMTLKEKIGQLFIHTVSPQITQYGKADIKKAVTEYHIGGLLFSGGQVLSQIEMTNYAQSFAKIPLMLTFDGEWGLAMRLKQTVSFPRNRVLGCISEDSLLYAYGREVARQCKEIGVHVNFAPVADVDNNPKNPVINTRSFGSNPQQVARQVAAYAKGLEDGGVIAVCKHFPGHGDTETDSHKSLPKLNFDRTRLDSLELIPFKTAIASGISGMMTGHLLIPALDTQKPASLSHAVVTQLLKNELQFDGLAFTDALAMHGVAGYGHPAAQALIAGNDLILVQRNLKKEMDGVLSALKRGSLTEEQITEKCRKVLTYKYILGLTQTPYIQSGQIMNRINTPEAKELVNTLKKKAVTVISNRDNQLPVSANSSGNLLVSISKSPSRMHPLYEQLRKSISIQWINLHPDSSKSLLSRIQKANRVIIAIESDHYLRYAKLLNQVTAQKPTVMTFFTPLAALRGQESMLKKAQAVIAAHTGEAIVQQHVADIIIGKSMANGRLSIDLGDTFKAGTGITLNAPSKSISQSAKITGINTSVLNQIDEIALEGIQAKAYPGCHILVMKKGSIVYDKCFGTVTYESKKKVRPEHLYDLASLSKATGTLLAVMKLYDEGKINLTDKISKFLPQFKGTNKENITIQELLFHESGLPAYLPFYKDAIDLKSCKGGLFKNRRDACHTIQVGRNLYACTDFNYRTEWVSPLPSKSYPIQIAENLYIRKEFKDIMLQRIIEASPRSKNYRYSCLNFMLLKEAVENITRQTMDVFIDSVYFRPMKLERIAYQPLRKFKKEEIIPTVSKDFLRGSKPLQGFVHDEAAAFLGGVSGNAGMFSSAPEVAAIFQMLLNQGVYNHQRFLSKETCKLFTTMKSSKSRRGLGFDKPDPNNAHYSPCASEAPACVFGHTGFSGTCAWADPQNDIVMVFLCNRIYPNPYSQKNLSRLNIRPRIQETIYKALQTP